MSQPPKNQSCKSSCPNRSNLRNDYDQSYSSRNAKDRPQRITFSEDYYNPNESVEDSFYSANESRNDPNLSVDNASFYTAEPEDRRNNQRFAAHSTPQRQRPQQDFFYGNAPLPSINRTLPLCCRTGQDSYDRSGADMSSGYFNRSQANSSRASDMHSGYFDRNQPNTSCTADMSSGYFDRNRDNSSRGADMSSGYYNRNRSNLSRRHIPDPGSPFIHLSQNDTTPFSFLDDSHNSSGAADMSSGYYNRNRSNLSRRHIPDPGSPFIHVSQNDTTPFSFLDDSHNSSGAADMSSRYFNRSPTRYPNASSSRSPPTHLSKNETASFSFLDDIRDMPEPDDFNHRSSGNPVSHLSRNDTTSFSFLDDIHDIPNESEISSSDYNRSYPIANSYAGSSFTHLSRNDTTPFSFLDDCRDISRYPKQSPPRSLKSSSCSSFYSANESQIDDGNDTTFYSAEPGSPRNKHKVPKFAAQSTPNRQIVQQDFYDNIPFSPINRSLPPCCRPRQDFSNTRRGADMNSDYFDRSQANSSRGADMTSGYFDRSQANSSRGADMTSGYFDRSQPNSSRGADMTSGYFDRSKANSSRGADMTSGYYNRSKINSSRPDRSYLGSPFTHVSRMDDTPFSFLDENQAGSYGGRSRVFNRSPWYNYQNDNTPFSFLDNSQACGRDDMSSRYRNNIPTSSRSTRSCRRSTNDTTPFSFLDDNQASCGGGYMNSGYCRSNDNDFSFMDDANDLQYMDPIPQRSFKSAYSAPTVCSNLK